MVGLEKLAVGDICDCFCGRAEGRWRVLPAHREADGDGDQGGLVRTVGEDHAEFEGIAEAEEEAVETIGKVRF